MTDLYAWAARWSVPYPALQDLQRVMGLEPMPAPGAQGGDSEAAVQAEVRLEAAEKGILLCRNNVGVLKDERGRPVRFGLANDSPAVNARIKSGDLIGIRPVLVTPEHVGRVIGQFVSRETKHRNWRYAGGAHEEAQLRWAEKVLSLGGDACFAAGRGTL